MATLQAILPPFPNPTVWPMLYKKSSTEPDEKIRSLGRYSVPDEKYSECLLFMPSFETDIAHREGDSSVYQCGEFLNCGERSEGLKVDCYDDEGGVLVANNTWVARLAKTIERMEKKQKQKRRFNEGSYYYSKGRRFKKKKTKN